MLIGGKTQDLVTRSLLLRSHDGTSGINYNGPLYVYID